MFKRQSWGVSRALKRKSHETLWRRSVSIEGMPPIVTFTFDDFPRSAYTTGGEILKKYDARGTYFVSMNLLNSEGLSGPHFFLDDLRNLVEDGHELGCHTFSHYDAKFTPSQTYEKDIVRNAHSLRAILPSYRFRSFAYPFGRVTLRTKKIVGGVFDCCRGTYDGINTQHTDLNLLRSNGLNNDSVPMNKVEYLIEQNKKLGGWVIFYTHDVREHYSSGGCSPDYFESAVRYASESDSRILTMTEAFDTLL